MRRPSPSRCDVSVALCLDQRRARILDRTVQSEKERQIIAMMQTTVMRMSALIDDVLYFARGRLGGGISLDRNTSEPLERTPRPSG